MRGIALGAAAICLVASAYALSLERLIPADLHLTPHVDSLGGVPGTMPNMALTTDEPLSTDAQPAPHPADAAPDGRLYLAADDAANNF